MSVKPISQRDSKWKDIKLGFSDYTIGTHGCTITALAAILETTPDVVNTKLKEVKGFSGANVIWAQIPLAFPQLKLVWRDYKYDNQKALDNIPLLIEVSGEKLSNPRGKHWVVFIGNKQMMDPWTGVVKASSWYGAPTGMATVELNPDYEPGEEKLYTETQMTSMRDQRDANHNLYKTEKTLHSVTSTELKGIEDNNKIELETEKKRLKTIADNMGIMHLSSEVDTERPKLWAKVVTESASFGKYKDGYDEFKLKYEQEVEGRALDLAAHQVALQELKNELKLEQDKNNKKVDNIAKKIEVALEQNDEKKEAVEQDKIAKVAKEQLVQKRKNWFVKFIERVKALFTKG